MEDFDRCYRAVRSRDARFDGWFFTAVTSTGVYCRPSCPARTPKPANVRFYPTAAAAQQSGFRACLRCRPDAAPGSPEWLGRADTAARAVRLVFDGVVDREGVSGLARRLGYGERQLHRVLVAEVGTGALALARAQRAQTARVLLETTDLSAAQVAFAAGFASVRQFNDTVRAVFARTPTELRATGRRRAERCPAASHATATTPGMQTVSVRLAHRRPLAAQELFDFLGARAVPGVEEYDGSTFRRTLVLPHGQAVVELMPGDGHVRARIHLADLRDLTTAIARCRRLCDLDADPTAVDAALTEDPALAASVAACPGLRVPGSVDGFETVVRAVLGQQVSVAGARKLAGSLVQAAGTPLGGGPSGTLTHTFPDAAAVADVVRARPASLGLPAARRRALGSVAEAASAGDLVVDAATTTEALSAALAPLAGIGPWTLAYVAMRALGDPDAFVASDLGVRRGAAALGLPDGAAELSVYAERWRPWRAHAVMHLWAAAVPRSAASTSAPSPRAPSPKGRSQKGERAA